MKRIALAAIAAVTFAAPLAIASPAAADPPRYERGRGDNDYDNRDDRRDERSAYRDGRRDQRRADRWNDRRYDGYTSNGRFFRGPPPRDFRGDVRFEHRNWRRGERLSSYHRSRYRQIDYRREHLRAPPRGYQYVEDDRGDALLVGVATGIILSVILAGD